MASNMFSRLNYSLFRSLGSRTFCLNNTNTRAIILNTNAHRERKSTHFQKNYNSQGSGETVYRGILARQLKMVKILSLTTSVLGAGVQPVIISNLYQSSGVFAAASIGVFGSFFILGTPLLLQFVAKRYVIQLDYNPENKEFKAVVLNLFNRMKSIKFQAKDVVIPELPALLATFTVKGNPLFVDIETFTDLTVYKHLMGLDDMKNESTEK